MAETLLNSQVKRCAVVTGANKGVGLEICRQLASGGIFVVLTSRNRNQGLEAVANLKKSGLSNVVFHQVDVTNQNTVSSLAEFISTRFGKLDILVKAIRSLGFLFQILLGASATIVNNAGILGAITDAASFTTLVQAVEMDKNKEKPNLKQVITETYESAVECIQTNYCGVKSVTKALIPLLQLSESPRIVNVSSALGKLKFISNQRASEILNDGDGLKEESVDEIVNMFLKDFKEDILEIQGWHAYLPAYTISKVCLNAYTRILAREFPTFRINCVSPGWVKTDICYNSGVLTTTEGAERVIKLVLVPNDGPSGLFFTNKEVTPF
ncbi:hypothetical protein C5167_048469 [Papaver somniferum]|uniref:Salutaridine reductase n=1 Tax=Papaver somniferum TaxID=3469 RepID=A0A4Y7KLM1_PAPSO|nr:hypothetical protein C5167_048469 [Papaver somniferum]